MLIYSPVAGHLGCFWNTHVQKLSWTYAFTSPGSTPSSEKAGSEQISVFSSNALLLECLEIEPFFLCGQGSDFKQKFSTERFSKAYRMTQTILLTRTMNLKNLCGFYRFYSKRENLGCLKYL